MDEGEGVEELLQGCGGGPRAEELEAQLGEVRFCSVNVPNTAKMDDVNSEITNLYLSYQVWEALEKMVFVTGLVKKLVMVVAIREAGGT